MTTTTERPEGRETMKAFAVMTPTGRPVIRVRTGDTFETFEFRTKRQADKKILSLIEAGYKFDARHATMKESQS
jgi:hypothetical protein